MWLSASPSRCRPEPLRPPPSGPSPRLPAQPTVLLSGCVSALHRPARDPALALAPRRELPAPSSKPPAHGQPRCTFGQPSLASSVTNDCPLPLSPSLGGEPSHSPGPRKTGIPRCFRGSSPASAPRPARNGPLFTHSPSRTCLCAPRVTNIVAPPVPLRPTIVSNYPLTPKVALPLPAPRLSSMCRSSTHPTFACSLRTPPLSHTPSSPCFLPV